MPQLNSTTFLSQMFWLIVSFSIMWMIVGNFIVPKIADIIQRRQRKIDDYLAAAEEFKQATQELISRYETTLSRTEQEVAKYQTDAEKALQEQKQAMSAEVSAQLEQKMNNNKQDLHDIQNSVKAQIDDLASNLAEKVLLKLNLPNIGRNEIAKTMKKDKK